MNELLAYENYIRGGGQPLSDTSTERVRIRISGRIRIELYYVKIENRIWFYLNLQCASGCIIRIHQDQKRLIRI